MPCDTACATTAVGEGFSLAVGMFLLGIWIAAVLGLIRSTAEDA